MWQDIGYTEQGKRKAFISLLAQQRRQEILEDSSTRSSNDDWLTRYFSWADRQNSVQVVSSWLPRRFNSATNLVFVRTYVALLACWTKAGSSGWNVHAFLQDQKVTFLWGIFILQLTKLIGGWDVFRTLTLCQGRQWGVKRMLGSWR